MSNESKHTPGPWAIDRDTEIWGSDNKLVGELLHDSMHDGKDNPTYPQFRFNAKLIAAAPELLENEKTNVSTIQHLMLMIKSGRYNEAFFLETLSRMEKDTNTVIKKATE